jgi:hypothetical protein
MLLNSCRSMPPVLGHLRTATAPRVDAGFRVPSGGKYSTDMTTLLTRSPYRETPSEAAIGVRCDMDEALHQTLGLRSSENGEAKPAKLSKKGSATCRGRKRLLNRESLDGRTIVAKVFDQLVGAIHADLGGRDRLSAIQLSLVEAFAGATVTLDHINTRLLTGAEIDSATVAMHAQSISAMVRVASRLGVERVARDVGPSLGDVLRADTVRQQNEERLRREVIDAEVIP